MANEADLKLIQIPEFPKTETLVGSGPEYVVLTKADGVTYGMLTEDFKAFLGVDALMQMGGAITPASTLPAEGDYFWPATEPGTYANAGGVVVPENSLALISRVDGVYSISSTEIEGQDLSGLATKAEFETVEPVSVMLVGGKNLIDKSKIIRGYYLSDGVYNDNVNRITTDFIPINYASQYVASGLNILPTGSMRFHFWNESKAFVSSEITNASTFQAFPEGLSPTVKFVTIQVANVADIGLNPTNNTYANSAQLELGSIPTAYEPFQFFLDASKIQGVPIGAAAESQIEPLLPLADFIVPTENLLDNSKVVAGLYSLSTGATSSSVNWIRTGELIPVDPNKEYTLLGIGIGAVSAARIAWFDSNGVYISGVAAQANKNNVTATSPSNAEFAGITIANEVIGGIGIGVNPTQSPYANTMMFNEGIAALPYVPFGIGIGAQYIIGDRAEEDEYPLFFVELSPVTTDYSGTAITKEVGKVYERLNGNLYIRHSLLYQRLDYSDFVSGEFLGGEIVRYAGSELASYNKGTGTFTNIGQVIVRTPESEFVMNDGGWVGGYHGNETLSGVLFMIDGRAYNPSGIMQYIDGEAAFPALPLTACNSFSYIQKSSMQASSDKSLLAHRKKTVTFIDGGYSVESRLEFQKVDDLTMYAGICCVSNTFSQAVSDSGAVVVPSASNLYPIDNDKLGRRITYSTSNIQATVATIIRGGDYEMAGILRLWDRSSDLKYYYMIPTYSATVGSILETYMTFQVKYNAT